MDDLAFLDKDVILINQIPSDDENHTYQNQKYYILIDKFLSHKRVNKKLEKDMDCLLEFGPRII